MRASVTETDATAPRPPAAGAVAYFDLDHTLINTSSGLLYYKYLYRLGQIGRLDIARGLWLLFQHKMDWLDIVVVARKEMAKYRGMEEARVRARSDEWFEEYVRHRVYRDAVEAIAEHRTAGHHTAILSAASPYVCRPMQEHLGLDSYVCTRFLVEDGCFTGDFAEPYCYGEGKITWAEQHAAERGLDLDGAYFYSDSYSDLPMLGRVGHPRVVNPDPRLRAHATQRGWPILRWAATV